MRCRVYETVQRPSVCPVIRLHRRRATPQHGAAARRSAADADGVICWMRWQIEREEFRNRAERSRTNTTRYRPGFGETICPARLWQFDGAYRFAANQAISTYTCISALVRVRRKLLETKTCVSPWIQKSRRIYVRPRTGPQSAHLWWPAVAKVRAASVPIA